MLIICPKCSAKYKIPDDVTLDDGQKLKCSACSFIFFKGEEAPLPLEALAVPESSVAPQAAEQPEPAFSKPLYTQKPEADSLPEAFQPVTAPTPKKKGSWLMMLLYIAIVVALCIAGWAFRGSLNPAINEVLPAGIRAHQSQPVKKTKPAPLDKKAVPTVKVEPLTEKPIPAKQEVTPIKPVVPKPATEPDEVSIKVLPYSDHVVPNKNHSDEVSVKPSLYSSPVILPPEESVSAEEPVFVDPNELPMPKSEPTPDIRIVEVQKELGPFEPNHTVAEQSTIPELPIPQPAIQPVEPLPDIPQASPDFEDEIWESEDEASLFELVGQTLPVGTEKELVVEHLTFRVEPDEIGQDQLLIEGHIQNQSSETLGVPALTVLVLNRFGQVVADKKVFVGIDHLKPMENIPFFTGINPAPTGVDRVEVHF